MSGEELPEAKMRRMLMQMLSPSMQSALADLSINERAAASMLAEFAKEDEAAAATAARESSRTLLMRAADDEAVVEEDDDEDALSEEDARALAELEALDGEGSEAELRALQQDMAGIEQALGFMEQQGNALQSQLLEILASMREAKQTVGQQKADES